jgi:hypothetical protein
VAVVVEAGKRCYPVFVAGDRPGARSVRECSRLGSAIGFIMRTHFFLLSALLLASCNFGDDGRLGADPDASEPEPDAMPDARTDATPIDAPLVEKVLEVAPNPPLPIRDNDPVGATTSFTVLGVTQTTGLDVVIDVVHTWSQDLRIELLRGTEVLRVLKAEVNDLSGGIPFVLTTYPVPPEILGTAINGSYTVRISDRFAVVAGTVKLVRLTFKVK